MTEELKQGIIEFIIKYRENFMLNIVTKNRDYIIDVFKNKSRLLQSHDENTRESLINLIFNDSILYLEKSIIPDMVKLFSSAIKDETITTEEKNALISEYIHSSFVLDFFEKHCHDLFLSIYNEHNPNISYPQSSRSDIIQTSGSTSREDTCSGADSNHSENHEDSQSDNCERTDSESDSDYSDSESSEGDSDCSDSESSDDDFFGSDSENVSSDETGNQQNERAEDEGTCEDEESVDIGFCDDLEPPQRDQFAANKEGQYKFQRALLFYTSLDEYAKNFNLCTPNGKIPGQAPSRPFHAPDAYVLRYLQPKATTISRGHASDDTHLVSQPSESVNAQTYQEKLPLDESKTGPISSQVSKRDDETSDSEIIRPEASSSGQAETTTYMKSHGVFNGSRSMLKLPSMQEVVTVDPFADIEGIIVLSA